MKSINLISLVTFFLLAGFEYSLALKCPTGGCGQLWKNVTTCTAARQACLQECDEGDCPQKCSKKHRACLNNGGNWPARNGRPGMSGLKPT